jgi:hypothetical protein
LHFDRRCDDAARRKGEKTMNVRALVFGLALTMTTAVGAEVPLAIRVSPVTAFAPATLVIKTRVEPDSENRWMEVAASSDGFFRSSAIQLEGARAPKSATFEFRSLPPGEYEITDVVIGAGGQRRAVVRAEVRVIESGSSK